MENQSTQISDSYFSFSDRYIHTATVTLYINHTEVITKLKSAELRAHGAAAPNLSGSYARAYSAGWK